MRGPALRMRFAKSKTKRKRIPHKFESWILRRRTAARELEITWSEKGRKEFLERSIARTSTLALSASTRAPFEGRSFLGAKWESVDRCNCMRCLSQRLASFRENHARLRKLHLRASRHASPCTVSSTVAKERERERERKRLFSFDTEILSVRCCEILAWN